MINGPQFSAFGVRFLKNERLVDDGYTYREITIFVNFEILGRLTPSSSRDISPSFDIYLGLK